MLVKKLSMFAVSVTSALCLESIAKAEPEMVCTADECTIDYAGYKTLDLVVPDGVETVDLTYNGSGRVKVKSKTAGRVINKLIVNCVGSGRVDLKGLRSREAKVKYRGSGDLNFYASELAKIVNSGSGDINVSGPAKLDVSGHGSGKVNRED